MNAQEIATFIIKRWIDDHAPALIMIQLICLGHPLRKADVLHVVRKYVDSQTENRLYTRND